MPRVGAALAQRPPSAARDTAIDDAEALRRALERRREHAFSVGVYFLVRGATAKELDDRTKRVRQIVRELGGKKPRALSAELRGRAIGNFSII